MPEPGFEPGRVSPTVFKTVASAIPPLRQERPWWITGNRQRFYQRLLSPASPLRPSPRLRQQGSVEQIALRDPQPRSSQEVHRCQKHLSAPDYHSCTARLNAG